MPILIVLVALAAAGWLGYMAAAGANYALIMLAASAATALFAFFSPRLSLVLLLFSMLLSPEIGFGAVDASRSLVVRYDDIFIAIIFMSWFARTAIFKHKPFITATPVQTPVLLYTALCVVSTALGVIRGDINWKVSSLYVLKYIEYFLLFFMTVNIVDSEEEIKKLLKYGLVVAALVTVYAYFYYYVSGVTARATAPFEAPFGNPEESEPASLGGYYLLVFGVLLGLISEGPARTQLLSFLLLAGAFPAFLFTYSRASYIGFAAMLPALLTLTGQRRLFLIGFLAAGALAFGLTPSIKSRVMERITMTYSGVYATHSFDTALGGQVKLEESAAARIWSLKRVVLQRLPARPIFGWGVTGIGIGDTQYALVLGELGLLGAGLFIWMIYRLFRTALTVYRAYKTPLIRALSLGFVISLVGLLFQAVGVNTFIIVRIMEPFWFLAALLSVLYLKVAAGQKASGPAPGR
ncbi:MAG: O-antigen ligase family protein [Elusimicrobiales bacterium]|nr:O-antigen ligase family protein [Elusimicrobiales bacterium]